MRRKLLCSAPLIEPTIGAAPHRDLPAAVWLLSNPFNYVVAILCFLDKRAKFSLRISAAARVHAYERIAALREIQCELVPHLSHIRSQCKDDRRRRCVVPRHVQGGV